MLLYAGFAALATLLNLGVQRGVLALDGGFVAAVAAGTLAGLVLKYLLDKRWIFYDVEGGLANPGRKFALYTTMGLVTTAIFWGTETLFWWLWHTDAMRELGAVIGLTIGYVTKYQLDKRFVFAPRHRAEAAE